jgi:hypothetical protein
MKHNSQVCSVSCIGGRKLEVTFTDGVTRELEIHNDWNGYLEPLNEGDFLARVFVDPVAHRLRLVKRDWFRSGCIARRS